MRNLKLTIAYDGTRHVGWQLQAAGESVQGLLEQALTKIEGAPVVVHGAGRTDAGVHALGQVASASVESAHDANTFVRALNATLPEDVRVLSVQDVPADFHARFSATSKTYRYVLRLSAIATPFERLYAWQLAETLDLMAMRRAAHALVGTHDFATFQSAGTDVSSTVRTISRSEVLVYPGVTWDVTGKTGQPRLPASPRGSTDALIAYEVSGNGFLRHMVRAIVGTLVEVGRGRRAPGTIGPLLAGGNRAAAGPTAPAHGLFLVAVVYD